MKQAAAELNFEAAAELRDKDDRVKTSIIEFRITTRGQG